MSFFIIIAVWVVPRYIVESSLFRKKVDLHHPTPGLLHNCLYRITMQILHSSSCFRVFHFGAFLSKASHGRRKTSEVENLKKNLNLPCKTIVICLTDDYDESLLFFPKQTTYTTYYLTHITHTGYLYANLVYVAMFVWLMKMGDNNKFCLFESMLVCICHFLVVVQMQNRNPSRLRSSTLLLLLLDYENAKMHLDNIPK